MSRVLRKISALNSMRNDWMMFAGRMMKSRQVGQTGAALVGDELFLCQTPMASRSIICACRSSMVENSGMVSPFIWTFFA